MSLARKIQRIAEQRAKERRVTFDLTHPSGRVYHVATRPLPGSSNTCELVVRGPRGTASAMRLTLPSLELVDVDPELCVERQVAIIKRAAMKLIAQIEAANLSPVGKVKRTLSRAWKRAKSRITKRSGR